MPGSEGPPFVQWTGSGVLAFDSWALGEVGVSPEDAFEVAANVLAARGSVAEVLIGDIEADETEDGTFMCAFVRVMVRRQDARGLERAFPSETDRDAVASALGSPTLLLESLSYLAASDAGACTECFGGPDGARHAESCSEAPLFYVATGM